MTDFATELLQKPDFEDGQIGSWDSNSGGSESFAVVAVAGQSFTKALKVTFNAAPAHAIANNTLSYPATEYQVIYLSAWLNLLNTTGDAKPGLEWLNPATWSYVNLASNAGAGWGKYSGSLTAPAATTGVAPAWLTWAAATVGEYLLVGPQSRSFYDPARQSWLWLPTYNTKTTLKPRILDATYGDGYQQRAADGINTNPESWDLRFKARTEADAVAMDDFLRARGGHESFQWIAPNNMNGAPNVPLAGNPKLYICKTHDITRMQGPLFEVSATFEEVFDL